MVLPVRPPGGWLPEWHGGANLRHLSTRARGGYRPIPKLSGPETKQAVRRAAVAKGGPTRGTDHDGQTPLTREILQLQQQAGNEAVTDLLVQRKAATPAASKPKQSSTPRVDALETQVRRLQNQGKAILHLDSFKEEVMARAAGWEQAALKVGSAYAIAAKNHIDAVEAKKKMDAIQSQMMFSVLTIATAGGLSWMSGAANAAKMINTERLLTKVLLDTVSAAGGEVFSGNGPGIAQRVPTPDQTAVSEDPLVFQNQRVARLKSSEQKAHLQFKAWTEALMSTDQAMWDTYDEQKQVAGYQEWVKKADLLSGDDKLPSIEEMAAELERGFWSRWAPALKIVASTFQAPEASADPEHQERYPKTNIYDFISPGSAIEKRWDILGVTKASGVGEFGWWTSETEIDQVVNWAIAYKVKSFMD
jgi:hypothetical protein